MPLLKNAEVCLYYEREGSREQPPLLLSNSLGTTFAMWAPQVNAFSAKFDLIRYDARGHGSSSVPAGPYSIRQMGEDVLRLLDQLEFERVHFCGLSLGGMVGQWLAVHAPARLDRLVLSNTAAQIGTQEGWNQRIAAVLNEGMSAVVPSVLARWYTDAFRVAQPASVAATERMLLANDPGGYAASCAAVRDMDQRVEVRSIRTPTLVIAGRYDQVTPPEAAQSLADNIAGSRLVELEAAHLANVEAAAGFTDRVLQFLCEGG